jgi:threonine dehydrogenase-like Zn-dependent dehydrogenase
MIGGWRLGNSIDGVQAEYFRVPYAQTNLAKIPDDPSDEIVVTICTWPLSWAPMMLMAVSNQSARCR